jgi:hypothetical protein
MAGTRRQREIARNLSLLIPLAPWADAEAIREAAGQKRLATLPPSVALWLAAIAHIRHRHTSYEALLAEGYDRESARFFVVGEINRTLTAWRATRLLDPDGDEDETS